jgi:hypothetical protein
MAMKGLWFRRKGHPGSYPAPQGWRGQAVVGQLATRKSPAARGPRCRARARGAELGAEEEGVAPAPAPPVGGCRRRCEADVQAPA